MNDKLFTEQCNNVFTVSEMGKTYLVCESLCQQWKRISNKMELIWSNALTAVGCNG